MNTIDIIIVALYLIGLFTWAIQLGIRETTEDFLILSRKAPFFLVLFSVVSSWVGTGTTVATAASGYDVGISLGLTAACGGLVGVLVAAWFAPRLKWFGDKFKAHTIGDFFLVRYSNNSQTFASGLILLVYILLTSAQFVGMTTLLSVWTGIEFNVLVWFAAISTIIYTAFAGIKSDFYTDVIHFFVMFIVLFFVLFPVTLSHLGGFVHLKALPNTFFNPFQYGGISFFIAGILFGGGSVFVTMEIWQRIYASTTAKTARYALAFSVIIIIWAYLISTFFGMSMHILKPGIVNRDQTLFILMKDYLPTGLLGLGLAGFLAIFVSTVNTTIMVASATLTKDFYKMKFQKHASEKQVLIFGRVATLICGSLGLLIAILFPNLVVLSVNSLFTLLILVPPIIGGFFWKKATSKGAMYSILFGGLTLIIFFFIKPETAFVPGFFVSMLTFVFVSIISSHGKEENINIFKNWKTNPKFFNK